MFHSVRRRDKEIVNSDSLKKILKSSKYVTLAFSKDNQPYLVTLSHGYDDERNCIYFHCAPEGKKLEYIKSNNVVWGQAMIDYGYAEGECDQLYASVHFRGDISLLDNLDDKKTAIECMTRQLDKRPEILLAKLTPERLGKAVFGRIDITYMSGKKSHEVSI